MAAVLVGWCSWTLLDAGHFVVFTGFKLHGEINAVGADTPPFNATSWSALHFGENKASSNAFPPPCPIIVYYKLHQFNLWRVYELDVYIIAVPSV